METSLCVFAFSNSRRRSDVHRRGGRFKIRSNVERVAVLLGFLLLACSSRAIAASDPELIEILESSREELKTPGARAAIRMPDGEVLLGAVGLADQESSLPLDDSIGMPCGSVGKTFVATIAMLLVEEGVISLDDHVSKWLGETEWIARLPNGNSMRIKHLLSHTSGIKDYPETTRFQFALVTRVMREGSAFFEPEELIEFSLNKQPLFEVGEGFHYSDTGYLILGLLIEKATGQDYYELLEKRILEPLDMKDARPARESVLKDIATGYTGGARNLKKDGRMKFDPSSEFTGGGLVANPNELVKFFGALAEGRIVTQESLEQMLRPEFLISPVEDWGYGLGVFVYDNGSSFGHGGRWPGYRTHVIHDLRTGITIAVQTNRDGRIRLESVAERLARLARNRLRETLREELE